MHISEVEKYRAAKEDKMRNPEPSKAEKEASQERSDFSAMRDMMYDKMDEKTGRPYQKGKKSHLGVSDSVGVQREYEDDPHLKLEHH